MILLFREADHALSSINKRKIKPENYYVTPTLILSSNKLSFKSMQLYVGHWESFAGKALSIYLLTYLIDATKQQVEATGEYQLKLPNIKS